MIFRSPSWLAALAIIPTAALAQQPQTPRPTSAPQARPAASKAPATAPTPAPDGLMLNTFLDQQGQAFTQMDTDRDGLVSPREFAESRLSAERERAIKQYQAMFASLDANKDGVLSGPEFMKLAANPQVRDTKPEFDALDSSRDGKLSRSEYLLRMTTNFDRLDTNKDGTIDAAELARSQQAPQGR